MPNPCLSCGACCAFYRATFYWREADDATPGGVPVELTVDFDDFYRIMKGTDSRTPRCVALEGRIGDSVRCSIYERRAGVCREFKPSYQNGESEIRCDKARLAHGMSPLKPEDWQSPETTIHPAA